MSLEAMIRDAAEFLRTRWHTVSHVVDAAITAPGVPNEDFGAGVEPGRIVMTVNGRTFVEDDFVGCQDYYAVAAKVEVELLP